MDVETDGDTEGDTEGDTDAETITSLIGSKQHIGGDIMNTIKDRIKRINKKIRFIDGIIFSVGIVLDIVCLILSINLIVGSFSQATTAAAVSMFVTGTIMLLPVIALIVYHYLIIKEYCEEFKIDEDGFGYGDGYGWGSGYGWGNENGDGWRWTDGNKSDR
jgi:hypothetical protein